MTIKRALVGVVFCALACASAGCGAGGKAQADSSGNAKITVALPFASCLAWWPFYAAEQQGYYDDQGVAPKFEGLDGSSAAIQATLSGKADIAVSAPDNYLSATAEGAELTGWFSVYQTQAFFLVTPKDSGITSPDGLAGKTIGISTPGGGDVTYAESLLKLNGLQKDKDYHELAVGDGGSAGTALKKGAVAAYSASYFDEAIIKAGGIELNTLSSDEYPKVVGQLLVSTTKWNKQNADVVDKFGKAVAQGTAWGLANRDKLVDMCAKVAPDETKDRAFARVIVDRVADLVTLPASADGKYGVIDEAAWKDYRDLLVDLKIVSAGAAEVGVDNTHVGAWND